ncbi:MAG: hypothetical protein QOE68_3541 [Thermoanaerobaculia bacterium]|jgi:hypothetical protein|nr:hypothetical protein [Thermoanaerobaculia bacterium]
MKASFCSHVGESRFSPGASEMAVVLKIKVHGSASFGVGMAEV